jgi:hypothetical protein
MKHQSRLAAVAEVNLQIAHAEAVVAHYARMVERPRKGADEDAPRWAEGKLRAAQERLERLGRAREAILAGEEAARAAG